MSCPPFDLRDHLLGELSSAENRSVELHLRGCRRCREELERLQLTRSALVNLRDEEIPQRIAFVSDKIFEPSPVRRWWHAFWGSAARLGFASAVMLSAAIIVYALKPVPPPAPVLNSAQLEARIAGAVRQAVQESELRQSRKTEALLAEAERRHQLELKSVELAYRENFEWMQKRYNVLYTASLR